MDKPMTRINIQFTRFSAFYSPLISAISGGFLKEQGLDPTSAKISPVHRRKWQSRKYCDTIISLHASIMLVRKPELLDVRPRKKIIVDHGVQPMVMFRYACHRSGIDFSQLDVIDAGNSSEMDAAFRGGLGDYIHLQGPAPQQLEHDAVGYVVASVGDAIGTCGFSSLAATKNWLVSDMAKAFMRAYRNTRAYINETPAEEIAAAEASFFPHIDRKVLVHTMATYQKLGCWSPHVEITPAAYEVTLDVFEHAGRIKTRHPYETVCAPPPA